MTMQTATSAQVRNHYKAMLYDVRISRDGHVEYRNGKKGYPWREGRYVTEYVADTDGNVQLR